MKQELITDSFDGYVRLNGLFLIRETTGSTIILGKTSTPFTFEGEYPEDEFWQTTLLIDNPRRFLSPKFIDGYRADQILCMDEKEFNISMCKEIK